MSLLASRARNWRGHLKKVAHSICKRWHQRKDGSRFWGSGLCMSVEGGGFLKIFRDATVEHEHQAALRGLNETLAGEGRSKNA